MRPLVPQVRSTRQSLAVLVGTNLLMGMIGLFTSRLALQLLGADGRGDLAALQNVPLLLAVVGGAGMGDAALYFAAKSPDHIRQIVDRALRVALVSSSATMIVAIAVAPVLLDEKSMRGAQLFSPIVVAVALLAVLHQPLRATGHLKYWSLFRAGPAVAWLSILLVAWIIEVRNPVTLALAFLGAHLVLVLAGFALRLRYPRPVRTDATDVPPVRELLRYGIPSGLVSVPQVLNLRVDQIIMVWVVTRADLGLYATAAGWSTIGAPVFIGLGQLLVPRLASIKQPTEQRRVTRRAVLVTFGAAAVLAGIGVPATVALFPLLMGDAVRPVIHVGQLLLVAGCISGIQLVLGEIQRGLGRPRVTLVAELIGLGSTAVTLSILLPRYGLVGAAVASIVSYSTVVAALLFALARHHWGEPGLPIQQGVTEEPQADDHQPHP